MTGKNVFILLIFTIFAFFHFFLLSTQEFIGDEASPMLMVDRMWDAATIHDVRFLGYPFLFYMDPYRSIFSGTLLHIFGPDRIILRLPSIIFGLITFWLLVWIFKKEKIVSWLMLLSIISYSLSPLIINDRSGGGDAQTRFLFLLTGYLLFKGIKQQGIKMVRFSLFVWSIGMLTMLDIIALLPGIVIAFWEKRSYVDKKIWYMIIGIMIFFVAYFSAWLILPYLAYASGIQEHYINRGLFYYFNRVNEGVAGDPFLSFKGLINYTSFMFAGWLLITFLINFKIKKLIIIQLISIPAWLFVILLNRASFHIIMYAAFFFFQAVVIMNYLVKKYPILKFPFIILLTFIIFTNTSNLFNNYLLKYKSPTKDIVILPLRCLDTAVVRMYKDHGRTLPQKACEPLK